MNVTGAAQASPSAESPAMVETVRGPIPVSELGFSLMHEHVIMNWMKENRLNGLLHDNALMAEELRRFKAVGGGTIVELTSIGLGRNPTALREISDATGLHVIMGTGFYREPYLERSHIDRSDATGLAELLLQEVEVGVDGTGIKPGIIGEVGQNGPIMTAIEERAFRAAALTQTASNLTLSTHAARWPVGISQLNLLEELGVDPSRVIIGHCDTVPSPEYHLEVARRGAYVQFDTLCVAMKSQYELNKRVAYVTNMIDAGYVNQVLLSHDVCLTDHLTVYGGGGYSFITDRFFELLTQAGVSHGAIRQMCVINPSNALTPS
jgi:phosphotriesterase-related protein